MCTNILIDDKLIPDFYPMKRILPILLAMTLASCGTLTSSASWEERHDLAAPLLFNGNRSQVFWRCALIPNAFSGGPCQLGFKNQHNEIITLEQIKADVERYISGIEIKEPHQFFVLTFSPTVIMLVPSSHTRFDHQCRSENYRIGCFVISKMPQTGFNYGSRPEVVNGSFVFVLDTNSKPFYLPDGGKYFEFALPDSTLKLTANSAIWQILRLRSP